MSRSRNSPQTTSLQTPVCWYVVSIIKNASHELLENLKPLLVPHWRDFETNRAGIKIAISDLLFTKLPEFTYTEKECEIKGLEVYNFVYEHYLGTLAI